MHPLWTYFKYMQVIKKLYPVIFVAKPPFLIELKVMCCVFTLAVQEFPLIFSREDVCIVYSSSGSNKNAGVTDDSWILLVKYGPFSHLKINCENKLLGKDRPVSDKHPEKIKIKKSTVLNQIANIAFQVTFVA